MSEEYLWDRTGAPDPEIERLEGLLGRFGYREKPRVHVMRRWMALAASLVLLSGGVYMANRSAPTQWTAEGRQISEGQTMTTGATGELVLRSEFVGEVRLAPNSQLKMMRGADEEQRLALQRGTMHALIWAPPARFSVDTPSARTIDLGCAYNLTVNGDGSGLVSVETGWVAFQAGSSESFIPAGAACRTRPRSGPGIPYFQDASEELRDGLGRWDRSNGKEGLDSVLASARARDGISLWHLAVRTSGKDRELVVTRFAGLVPGIDAEGLMRGKGTAIDGAWNALGLGGTDWWRSWKHRW
jgi:FecR protein